MRARIGIVIPLVEELEAFTKIFAPCKKTQYVGAYSCHWFERDNVELVVILCHSMGNGPAQDAAEQLLTSFGHSLSLIICIGIGGAIHTDLRLGDVAVATSVADIIDAAKVSDGKDLYQLELMQRSTIPLSRFVSFANQFNTIDPGAYKRWGDECEERRREFRLNPEERIGRWKSVTASMPEESAVARDRPALLACHMASGLVFASREAIALRSTNREFKVVETEAAGVGRACSSGRYNVPFLVLRGISDFADGTKAKTEQANWREYAALNVMSYLRAVLDSEKVARLLIGSSHGGFDLSSTLRRFDETGLLDFERKHVVHMWPLIVEMINRSSERHALWIAAQDLWSITPVLVHCPIAVDRLTGINVVRISKSYFTKLVEIGAINPALLERFESNLAILRSEFPELEISVREWEGLPPFHGCLFGEMLWHGYWQTSDVGLTAMTDQRLIDGDHGDEFKEFVARCRRQLEKAQPVDPSTRKSAAESASDPKTDGYPRAAWNP